MTGRPSVELRLLGRFVVLREGREVPGPAFGGRKARALLRVLATRRGALVAHDVLTDALWCDRPPADPAANLQVLVNRARRALGRPELVVTGDGGYRLSSDHGCVVDAEQFVAAVDQARAAVGPAALAGYEAALALWAGEPLAEDGYAAWAADYRARLTILHQLAMEEAARVALDLGEGARAVELASAAAAAEPLREVAVVGLVRALAVTGDTAAALDRYEQFRRTLADELGVDPSAAAQEVHQELLRGDARPVTRGRAPAGAQLGRMPFVGRAAELEALSQVSTRFDVALLVGASGAGKSRLLEQLSKKVPVILARAFPGEQDEPWSLARSVVREALDADLAVVERLPRPVAGAVAWLLPELEPGTPGPPPDAESRRAMLVEAAVHLLGEAGRVIVIDDVQWADPTSLALVEAVLSRLDEVGAVLAMRPVERGGRASVRQVLHRLCQGGRLVELPPLSREEIGELAGDAALRDRLAAATDRTPIAVGEALRTLAAEGVISRTPQRRWRVVDRSGLRRAEQVAVAGQRQAIGRRADDQPAPVREVLHILALLGREASARVLALATERDEREVLDLLSSLAQAGLGRLGERGWAAAHDMVGDVVAGRLGNDERGRLHASIARALEETDAEPGEAAGHWRSAGDADRAATAYHRAAERALDAFANGEALNFADAGLALAPGVGSRAQLHQTRAEARARRGDIPGARSDLREAVRAHRPGPSRARLLTRLAALGSGAQDLVRAAELAELALVEAGDDQIARAQALEVAALLDMNLDRPERAEARAAEALACYERAGDANGRARILDGRAMATFLDGQVRRGTGLLRRVADLFEDSGDLFRVVTPRSTAGHGRVFEAEPADGLTLSASALELARTLGHPEGQTYALWHCAEALAALCRPDEALAAAEEGLAIAQRIGHRGWTATSYRALGLARQSAGEPESALTAFECSLELCENLNLFGSWAAARCALVLVQLGRPDAAVPLVAQALGPGPALGHFEARLAEVELTAARGDPATADLAQAALHRADAAGVRQFRDRLLELSGVR